MTGNRTDHGFTLIEMIIVTAIIGVLSIMGFSAYDSYVARAKQRLMKVNLANGYKAERTFFVEHHSFTHCLGPIGGLPPVGPPDEARAYAMGFAGGDPTNFFCGPLGNQSCFLNSYRSANNAQCACGAVGPGGRHDCGMDAFPISMITQAAGYSWQAFQTTFTIGAIGQIHSSFPPDVWTIDHNKNLVQVVQGSP